MKNLDLQKLHAGKRLEVAVTGYDRGTSHPYSMPPTKRGQYRIIMAQYETMPQIGDRITIELVTCARREAVGKILDNHGCRFKEGDKFHIDVSSPYLEDARDRYSPHINFGDPPNGICELSAIIKRVRRSKLEMTGRYGHKKIEAEIEQKIKKAGKGPLLIASPSHRAYRLNGNEIFIGLAGREAENISLDDVKKRYYGIGASGGVLIIADESHSVTLGRDGSRWKQLNRNVQEAVAAHAEARKGDIPIVLVRDCLDGFRKELEGYGFEMELLEEKGMRGAIRAYSSD
ncbi:MAG: hypothetical protein HYX24_04715 [Candidatus Aenigmarchaeota archaeon]|nr:hypothetical protein [Candidatus Aenigmarchaeota archaeon]